MARGDFKKLPSETLSEYGKKGAIKSAEVRRAKKEVRENLKILARMAVKKEGKLYNIEDLKSIEDFKGKNIDSNTQIALALHMRAMKGDIQAIKLWLELTGQNAEDW